MRIASILLSVCAALAQNEKPFPPHRVAGNVYFVGSESNASYLVTSSKGHIIINSGFEETVPIIRAGVEKLGFKISDVRILLASHAHDDHVAGLATLKALTGAKLYIMKGDDTVVASGGKGQYKLNSRWKPAAVDKVLKDRDQVTLGEATLTAHLTPGHTRGCTTWTTQVKDGGSTYTAVVIGSPNVLDGYRLVNDPEYPEIAADFERGFRALKSLQCDIFLGAHGDYYGMDEKYKAGQKGKKNPFLDPAGCRAFIEDRESKYLKTLAAQPR
jgi:metallo-beta-lactamase class B